VLDGDFAAPSFEAPQPTTIIVTINPRPIALPIVRMYERTELGRLALQVFPSRTELERLASKNLMAKGTSASCRQEPGVFGPTVNRSKCEGKKDCVDVCPENVFEVRRIDDADFAALGFFAKLKSRAHGRLTAYTPNADACRACGLCVAACPEKAIRLDRRSE
jgi:4Fe-4S ferredoxin